MADLGLGELIGVPFATGGRGPDTWDCYGLIRHLYQLEHGVLVPDYLSPGDATRISALIGAVMPLWEQVADGEPGSVAVFRVLNYGSHVGYCLPHGKFIHTWERSGGVCIERFDQWARRALGCYRFIGN